MKIDAHQHYWNPARGDYDWMPKDNPVLNRPYLPPDLAPDLAAHGIERTVLVQAAATVNETEYLLGLADATPGIAGVVGWVDFEDPSSVSTLTRLARHPKFLGVRPMIQDIPDVNWMLRKDVQWAYAALIDLDLSFDALGFPQHLGNFYTLLTRYPNLRTILDHCMKPQIRTQSDASFQAWAAGMQRLAEDTHAFLKLSGLVTEATDDWRQTDLEPYVTGVLEAFGPARIMWGSDWPVCRLQAEYSVWHDTAQSLTAHLSQAERAMIFGGTAAAAYRLAT